MMERNSFNVLFFLKQTKLLKNGEASVCMRITVNNVKNRIEGHIEERVVAFAIENPVFGQTRVSNELKKEGLFISPCGVRCVWLRYDLETFQKRLKTLESKKNRAQKELYSIYKIYVLVYSFIQH